MNERRKIARALSESLEPLLIGLGAGPATIEGALDAATTDVMNAVGFEDED